MQQIVWTKSEWKVKQKFFLWKSPSKYNPYTDILRGPGPPTTLKQATSGAKKKKKSRDLRSTHTDV